MRGVSGESSWRRSRIVSGVATPAAGADWSTSVPAGHLWQLLGVTATLVTSAAVANRAVALVLGDGSNPFLTIPAPAVQAASLTGVYSWAGEGGGYALGVRQLGPLPPLVLPPSWTVAVSTLLVDATDQWSAVRLLLLDTTVRRGRIDLDQLPDMVVVVAEAGPPESA